MELLSQGSAGRIIRCLAASVESTKPSLKKEKLAPGGRILVVPMLGGPVAAGISSHAIFKGLSTATASDGAIADAHVRDWLLTLTSR